MSVIERKVKLMPHRTIRNCKKRTAALHQKGKSTHQPDANCPKNEQHHDIRS